MARALLDWSTKDLSDRCNLSVMAINKIERGRTTPKDATIALLAHALSAGGAEFLPDDGVRRRSDLVTTHEGESPYLSILDDAFRDLHKTGGEMLFSFVSNRRSPPTVIESQKRLRACGVRFRMLAAEEDSFLHFPLREYRCVPGELFLNTTQVIYGNKVASMVQDGDFKKAIVINNSAFAATQANLFELVWRTSPPPSRTTAKVIYD